ncbi:MAG TPA: malectin domain-containing carbohydrate-binding protein, partial [Planctomycetota bacterium]|nr:malectin domain-containing carbohydrate-binding protein [Planctomycetota bacterium]
RVGESTIEGRTVVTYTDVTGKHPPAFMSFENPHSRTLPAKLRAKVCLRVNKPVGSVRFLFSSPVAEDLLGSIKLAPTDVGKWIEGEFTFTPKPVPKDEIYFKLGDYPEGFAVDLDYVEIYDLTPGATAPAGAPQAAPVMPGGAVTPAVPGVPAPPAAVPVVGGPAPGSRLFAQSATAKKLTTPETKIIVAPGTTSSLSTPGMSSRLFDGDLAGGLFSITNSDPKSASCWLVIDLGADCSVDGIKVYNFFTADRTYGQQVWQVCPYDDFLRSVVTVYNSDTANLHGQGPGADPNEKATKDGTRAFFSPVRGRYVRIWMNGNNDNHDNHIIEIEVDGQPGTAGLPVDAHMAAGDLKIHAGRGNVGDWKSEAGYAGSGIDQADAKPVVLPRGSLVIPEKLYNTYRGGAQTWNFPKLPDGNYWIRLHFQEPTVTAAGGRVFDVLVNDETALKGYDIFDAAGGGHKAVVETVAGIAAGGKGLKVEFKAVKGAPLLCGIEVLPTNGPLAPPARLAAPAGAAAPAVPVP